MSDVEDYRVKNAREGKALYFPGRPVEEIKAERDAANRKSLRLHLNVSLVEQDAWTMTATAPRRTTPLRRIPSTCCPTASGWARLAPTTPLWHRPYTSWGRVCGAWPRRMATRFLASG